MKEYTLRPEKIVEIKFAPLIPCTVCDKPITSPALYCSTKCYEEKHGRLRDCHKKVEMKEEPKIVEKESNALAEWCR